MVNIDNLVNEWAYRCKKGYPDMDSPSDLRVLKSILKEQGISLSQFQEQEEKEEEGPSKKELIDLINKSDLSSKSITRILKIVKGTGFRSKTKDLLAKNISILPIFEPPSSIPSIAIKVFTNSSESPTPLIIFPLIGKSDSFLGLFK